jgi:hypothetical protein
MLVLGKNTDLILKPFQEVSDSELTAPFVISFDEPMPDEQVATMRRKLKSDVPFNRTTVPVRVTYDQVKKLYYASEEILGDRYTIILGVSIIPRRAKWMKKRTWSIIGISHELMTDVEMKEADRETVAAVLGGGDDRIRSYN